MEVDQDNDGEAFRPRRSLRKKGQNRLRLLFEDDDEGNVNLWSDNSDDDPDFSPLGCVEREDAAKCDVVSRKRRRPVRSKIKKYNIENRFRPPNRYQKFTACAYCSKRYIKIVRHLEDVHGNESDVIKMMSLPLKSEERRTVINEIKAKGNSQYNKESDERDTEERRKNNKPRPRKPKRVFRIVSENKKVYKRNSCYYCQRTYLKLSRHYEVMHRDEVEVKKFVLLPKGSKERLHAIKTITNRGNFAHNREVILKKEGHIIPIRIQSNRHFKNYLPCKFCLGFYCKRTIYRHLQTCPNKKMENSVDDSDTTRIQLSNTASAEEIMKQLTGEETVVRQSKIPTKRTACYYCKKMVVNLRNHLHRKHAGEPEVKNLLTLQLRSKERYLALQAIRRKGNFIHNKNVMRSKRGSLIVLRNELRQSSHVSDKFLPCEYCFGFYKADSLIIHSRKCFLRRNSRRQVSEKYNTDKENRELKRLSKSLLDSPSESAECVNQVLSAMKNCFSKVMSIARDDDLILKYGAIISVGMDNTSYYRKTVQFKMRCLGKLLARMNRFDNRILKLSDCLKPEHFQTVVKAVLNVCSVQTEDKALLHEKFYRRAIMHCCMIAKSENLMNNNEIKLIEINDFLLLMHHHWFGSLLKCITEHELPGQGGNGDEISGKETSTCASIKDLGTINFSLPNIGDDFLSHPRLKIGICLFCSQARVKLPKHYLSLHSDEPEVRLLAGLQRGSEERFLFLMVLRNKGNYFHNKKVIEDGKGSLVVRRGLSGKSNLADYSACEHCLGYYKKALLTNHHKRCHLNPLIAGRGSRYFSVMRLTSVTYTEQGGVKLVEEMIPVMKNAVLRKTLLKDELIKKFGSVVAKKNSKRVASQKMTTLGMLLLHLRKQNSKIHNLRDSLQAKYFGDVMSTLKRQVLKGTRKSLPDRYNLIKSSIRTCCGIVKNESLVNDDENMYREIIDFMIMLLSIRSSDIYLELSVQCERNKEAQKRHCHGKVVKWNKKEIDTIFNVFSSQIKNEILPGKYEIVNCIDESECLQNRNWVSVKSKIYSLIKKHKLNCVPVDEPQTITSDPVESEQVDPSNKPLNVDIVTPFHVNDNCRHSGDRLTETNNSAINQNIEPLAKQVGVDQIYDKFTDGESRNTFSTSYEQLKNMPLYKHTILKERVNQDLDCGADKDSISEERTYVLLGSSSWAVTSLNEGPLNCDANGLNSAVEKPESYNSSLPLNENLNNEEHKNEENSSTFTGAENNHIGKGGTQCGKRRCRWNEKENEAIIEYFSDHIKRRKVPSKFECEDCISENSCLEKREWVTIKSKIHNMISSSKKVANRKDTDNICERDSTNKLEGIKKLLSPNSKFRRRIIKTPWTAQQNNVIDKFFRTHIEDNVVPGKRECEECIGQHECLAARSWVTVKSKVHNIIMTRNKSHQ